MIESLVTAMGKLGFTKYEARAYITLLQRNPATGYEISRASGVPRSAIYDVMRKLEDVGLVNALTSKPKQYVPLEPEKMLDMLKNRFSGDLKALENALSGIDVAIEEDHLWTIRGYDDLIQKARQMIDEAESDIFMSIWWREAKFLVDHVHRAVDRGVKVVAFSFTKLPFKKGKLYAYELSESDLEKIWRYNILLVSDMSEVLMGEADPDWKKKVAWTKNNAMINIAITNIILDVTLFGQRFNVDVSDSVFEMRNGELDYLGKLLGERGIETKNP